MSSNPKVRIVARIRAQSNKYGDNIDGISISKPWISVLRPDTNSHPIRVKISFGSDKISSGKQSCEIDDCYEQDVGNEEIFIKEIKPLISGLFGGQNSTVFAYGPRESGKTYTIQGYEEELGLAVLAVDAILPLAEEQGKIVTISVFEVYQDRVSDMLDTKRPEVAIFEDGHGKIRLKGLSKVKVNSTSEFQRLYLQAANARKELQKMTEPPHRYHTGCIVHVVSPQTDKSCAQLVGKINFVDLASYEDSRRKSIDGFNLTEATRINKSLYTVHNVLYALNAKDARVPYRESKLTRMLQDSLGGTSKILMISCMNPSLCQETVQTISLASRSCMAGFLACLDPGKSSRIVNKTSGMSSPQVMKSASKFNTRSNMVSPRVVKPMSASVSGEKTAGSKLHMSMKKDKDVSFEVKGRKLFDDTIQLKKSKLGNKCPESASSMESSSQRETSLSLASEAVSNSSTQQEEQFASSAIDLDSSQLPFEEDALQIVNYIAPTTPFTDQTPTEKENKSSNLNDRPSPPLSARIQELRNNLNSLCFSTDANLKMALESLEPETPKYLPKVEASDKNVILEKSEFKTPIAEKSAKENYELATMESPWESFHMRSSRAKDSLVQEYLKFFNTASKEELKGLKGIGEKRAANIIEMREESPEPFKQLDDLTEIGLSKKQIKIMMKDAVGELL
ncbi:kinesin-like protein KIN-10C isoform X2 [Chenopodium quinoa]|uniref:kinesin-like protein KIN-10C isoform X2 n=1 Tax=Chenopodium quinoa TaxID=63459 RepID=UPI000B76F904|nr:kinesin-like protein KIN-10C isoform X2 [Chenopodium quinoa]